MQEKNKFFVWCWDDEQLKSNYQLTVKRKTKYGKLNYRKGEFIWPTADGDENSENAKYFLRHRFELWYNHADVTDIEPFLDYQLKNVSENEADHLRFLQAIILAMPQFSDLVLNFEGKRQVGLNWVTEKLNDLKHEENFGKLRDGNASKLDFENVFIKKFITGNQLLEKLRGKYLDEDLNWVREPHDFKGLVHFLIDNQWVKTDKYATLQRILLSKINFKSPARASDAPKPKSIDQFEFLNESP